ncbi:Small polypeptide DEVIL 18 [Cardamine amara subsp. amara]|uniref:Small polypeptide DEVIL 18 n=1 Tax=Cardamine amara subsp. amara TaxID=228776 RepID=A0ABD1BY71_CARAN
MDVEKLWNLAKKDSLLQTIHFSSSSSSKPVFTRSFSTKASSSHSLKSHFTRSFSTKTSYSPPSSKPVFTRSFSTKPSSSSSCSSEHIFRRSFSAKPKASKSLLLSRSCSTKSSGDFSSKSSLSRSLSQKGASVTRKCCRLAKEHKSRFYIIKRCVLMLVCWHKHS